MIDQNSAGKNDLLVAALDHVDQGVVVYDQDLIVVAFNHRALEILEMPENEFSVGESFEKWVRYTAEHGGYGGKGNVEERVEKRLATARSFKPYRADQSRADNKVIEIAGNPVPGVGYITTYTDVTDRKKIEESLRKSEFQRRIATDNVPMLLIHFDRDWRYLFANKTCEEWYVRPADEILGKTLSDILGAQVVNKLSSRFERVLAGEKTAIEETILYPDGITRDVLGTYTPDFDEAGQVVGSFVVVQDITERNKTEAALRESEIQRRAATDNVPVVLVRLDLEWRFLFVNKTCEQWYARSADQIIGKTLTDIFGEAAVERFHALFAPVLDGETVSFEGTITYPDGVTRHVHSSYTPDLDVAGNVCGSFAVVQDITDRVRMEEARNEIEQRFRGIVDNSPSAIMLKDAEGKYLLANKKWNDWFNPDGVEVFGKTVHDFYPPSHAEEVIAHDREMIGTGIASSREYVTPKADGTLMPTIMQKFPVYNDHDQIIAIGAINTDITEQKRNEEARIEAESQFRAIFDGSPAAIALKDLDGVILMFNKTYADWAGIDPTDAIGRTAYDFHSVEDADEIIKRDRAVVETGETVAVNKSLRIKGGEAKQILSHKCPIRSASGEIFAIATIINDVTELREAEAQAIHADKLATLGRMAAGITHELAQPLNIIRLATQSALMDMADGIAERDDPKQTFEVIDGQVGRMAEIVDHMRVFARKDERESETFSPAVCVETVARFMAQQLSGSNISLGRRLPRTCGFVVGSPTQLEQVLLNLVSNASDSIHTRIKKNAAEDPNYRGLITIDLTDDEDAGQLRISVVDNGDGIPDDVRHHIFEPFYTTKEIGSGTGLGLSVSFTIINAMGGAIEVENVGDGAGITITLPRTVACTTFQELPETLERAEKRTNHTEHRKVVLVVEDEAKAGGYLAKYLERSGYSVVAATNGAEALEEFRSKPIDIVITDLQMPVMDGNELIGNLRAESPDLPIFVTTGKMAVGEDDDPIVVGATEVFKKPIKLHELVEKLEQIL